MSAKVADAQQHFKSVKSVVTLFFFLLLSSYYFQLRRHDNHDNHDNHRCSRNYDCFAPWPDNMIFMI